MSVDNVVIKYRYRSCKSLTRFESSKEEEEEEEDLSALRRLADSFDYVYDSRLIYRVDIFQPLPPPRCRHKVQSGFKSPPVALNRHV